MFRKVDLRPVERVDVPRLETGRDEESQLEPRKSTRAERVTRSVGREAVRIDRLGAVGTRLEPFRVGRERARAVRPEPVVEPAIAERGREERLAAISLPRPSRPGGQGGAGDRGGEPDAVIRAILGAGGGRVPRRVGPVSRMQAPVPTALVRPTTARRRATEVGVRA